jgi:hypothetical protein
MHILFPAQVSSTQCQNLDTFFGRNNDVGGNEREELGACP